MHGETTGPDDPHVDGDDDRPMVHMSIRSCKPSFTSLNSWWIEIGWLVGWLVESKCSNQIRRRLLAEVQIGYEEYGAAAELLAGIDLEVSGTPSLNETPLILALERWTVGRSGHGQSGQSGQSGPDDGSGFQGGCCRG